jgi:hypothetical protein
MDVALLAKRIYKLESGEDNLCLRLLRKKYTQGFFFIQTKPNQEECLNSGKGCIQLKSGMKGGDHV